MSEFPMYFGLGKDHILDYFNGYDHILFVMALCAVYAPQDWKRVLILITAFTIGHSITLALATFKVIEIRTDWIEFLIPLTIFITALSNILRKEEQRYTGRRIQLNYGFALFFGLIHGMGFSNYLQAILGKSQGVTVPLFGFNLGLEFGQAVIVVIFLSTCFIFVDLFGVGKRDWKLVISSAIGGISLILMKNNAFW
jgi:HupE / UreJ protein